MKKLADGALSPSGAAPYRLRLAGSDSCPQNSLDRRCSIPFFS